MKIAVYGHKLQSEDREILKDFFSELKKRNGVISVYKNYYIAIQDILEECDITPVSIFSEGEKVAEDSDYVFTFGGDGTILSAIHSVQDTNVPIVGVNTGRLGFLASLPKGELMNKLDSIFKKEHKISRRSILQAEISSGYTKKLYAINEVAISRKETTSMITVRTRVNGEYLNTFWGDGLIISTPTGSTGYSLSCGGPIIAPTNNSFVFTPIAPHNLNVRPLILDDDVCVDLEVESREYNYSLSLDSELISVSTNDTIQVRKADFQISMVEYSEYSYFETIRKKLNWGDDLRNL